MKGETIMEFKKGDTTFSLTALGALAGVAVVTGALKEICKVIAVVKKK